jgi:hypothetical protein
MVDNVAYTPGAGKTIATDEVAGVHYQRVKVTFGVDGAAADVSSSSPLPVDIGSSALAITAASLPLPSGASTAAKQPALGTAGTASADVLTIQGIASMTALKVDGSAVTQPVSGTVTVTGALTDTQLRASAVPVSLASFPALAVGSAIVGKVGIDQTTPGTTNKVSIGTDGTVAINAALPAGTALIGKTGIDQTTPGTTNAVSLAQVGSTTVATGNGVVGAGVQRVAIASDNTTFPVTATLAAGAATIGALTANQSVNNAQIAGVATATGNGVVGTGVGAKPVRERRDERRGRTTRHWSAAGQLATAALPPEPIRSARSLRTNRSTMPKSQVPQQRSTTAPPRPAASASSLPRTIPHSRSTRHRPH